MSPTFLRLFAWKLTCVGYRYCPAQFLVSGEAFWVGKEWADLLHALNISLCLRCNWGMRGAFLALF